VLLTSDWVVPISSPPIAGGAVLSAGGEIVDVGPAAQLRARYPNQRVCEYQGCALLPGFVNAHTHLDYSAFQGFPASRGFLRWIIRLTRARRRLSIQDLAASALWGAHECLRYGVTSIADTSYGGSTVARAAEAAGLRARVYLEVFGLDDTRLSATMERLEAALERAKCEGDASASPRVEWGVSPHATYTVSQALYGEVARVYKAVSLLTGRRWELPGVRPVEYVSAAGALGSDMLAVHAVQLDGGDIATLARSGAAVAHCPRSNLRLRCGVAPVVELRAAGITVGLGTDSLASNDSLDMLAEMRAALEVSVGRAPQEGVPALLPSAVLQMATLEGARALGWDHLVGSLEAGKRADITAVQLPVGVPQPASTEVLAQAVMQGQVRLTMVEGRVVYDGDGMPAAVVRDLIAVRTKLGLVD
jgi:cytosine/adenosine deaminase-related metal-dependent hydrolase